MLEITLTATTMLILVDFAKTANVIPAPAGGETLLAAAGVLAATGLLVHPTNVVVDIQDRLSSILLRQFVCSKETANTALKWVVLLSKQPDNYQRLPWMIV